MKNTTLVIVLAIALLPACAFAVDGVMLINQSTVMAAGNFPYVISNPGSYKLSGNLTMYTTQNGNVSGIDVAIGIAQSNVTLDLNGFSIFVVNNITNLNHSFFAIAELGTFKSIRIRNGYINLTGSGTVNDTAPPVAPNFFSGIYLPSSIANRAEDVSVLADSQSSSFTGRSRIGIFLGQDSLLRHVISTIAATATCPSVLVEVVGVSTSSACANFLVTAF